MKRVGICIFCLFIFSAIRSQVVEKSIYPENAKNKSKIYNKLWGSHYRNLYSQPIPVQTLRMDSLFGGVTVIGQAADLHGLYLEDKQQHLYMLKPLGGSTSFTESDFFRDMYNKNDFRGTYTDVFIKDAYTIINPYTFMASDRMARSAGLVSHNYRLYYLPPNSVSDTIADGSRIQDKIISIIDIPDIHTQRNILTTSQMLDLLQETKANRVDQDLYIRNRMFDILTGDWNKIPENWNWLSTPADSGLVFTPMVIDRNHAFTKVDGVMFKQLLNILTLGFIYNYDDEIKNLKKFNKLGFTLDVALTPESTENDWLRQAHYLQSTLTDDVIADAFRQLPENVQGEETDRIRENLILRRNNLQNTASEYYHELQRVPVLTGTRKNDLIRIDRSDKDSIHVHMYDAETQKQIFHQAYDKKEMKQMWIYGLTGDDRFEINGKAGKENHIYLIGGKGTDNYTYDSGKKLRVFESKEAKETTGKLKGVRTVYTDNETILAYDYDKTKRHETSFSPWGFYDSDLGINLGSFFTYTEYGFKRLPFSYQHRIGFNYLNGFMYRGIFPLYNEKQTFLLDANFGFPNNFYNFFGFGNETDGYKDEKRRYNRVNIRELKIVPSFRQRIGKYSDLTLHTSFELYKVLNPDDRFINTVYADDSYIFDYNYYSELGIEYTFEKALSPFIPHFEVTLGSAWKVNYNDFGRNFPYSTGRIEIDFRFSKLFTWATMIQGQAIYNNKYEFYHAANTGLRGFRSHRFIGKESLFESTDLRFDLGHWRNAFIPLKGGVFAGFDYGRVWYPGEDSNKWHTSYGGGVWMTLLNKITTKYSLFGSTDTVRFMFELGFGF